MKSIPGINIQWPWSQLLLTGAKTIETRGYPLPKKYEGVELALIETPGPFGKKKAGIQEARIIATITFSTAFMYKTIDEWISAKNEHLVSVDDPTFRFDDEHEKWGWVVSQIKPLKTPTLPPKPRGIVFASQCMINEE